MDANVTGYTRGGGGGGGGLGNLHAHHLATCIKQKSTVKAVWFLIETLRHTNWEEKYPSVYNWIAVIWKRYKRGYLHQSLEALLKRGWGDMIWFQWGMTSLVKNNVNRPNDKWGSGENIGLAEVGVGAWTEFKVGLSSSAQIAICWLIQLYNWRRVMNPFESFWKIQMFCVDE